MKIDEIGSFLDYYGKIRQRTKRVIQYIPEERLEWRYKEGAFSSGDLIRHIAAIERYVYAEVTAGRPSCYQGCGTDLAAGLAGTIEFMDRLHEESMVIFNQLSALDLQSKVTSPVGYPITCWKWLRALVEHEIHHRGQLYMYLGMLDILAPPIFGLTSEELQSFGKPSK
jgi:uncharacterized damage-inducible protein DinB